MRPCFACLLLCALEWSCCTRTPWAQWEMTLHWERWQKPDPTAVTLLLPTIETRARASFTGTVTLGKTGHMDNTLFRLESNVQRVGRYSDSVRLSKQCDPSNGRWHNWRTNKIRLGKGFNLLLMVMPKKLRFKLINQEEVKIRTCGSEKQSLLVLKRGCPDFSQVCR